MKYKHKITKNDFSKTILPSGDVMYGDIMYIATTFNTRYQIRIINGIKQSFWDSNVLALLTYAHDFGDLKWNKSFYCSTLKEAILICNAEERIKFKDYEKFKKRGETSEINKNPRKRKYW